MPRKVAKKDADPTLELLRDSLIIQLGLAGIPQPDIRKIVGVDINRVSRIVKLLKRPKSKLQ